MKFCVVEKVFDYKGYTCVVTFNKMGFRCGYVGVKEDHPWYGVDYESEGPNEISCHYGLTYSGKGEQFTDDDLWYFGFDCGHYMDATEIDKAKEYGLVEGNNYLILKKFEDEMKQFDEWTVKTVEFVEENCKMIAEQLIVIKKKDGVYEAK